MGRDTLQKQHNKFAGTGTSQTCKGEEEFKVTNTGAGEVLTWEVLKTGLHRMVCLEAGFMYWYVGVVVTFTPSAGGTKNGIDRKTWKNNFDHFTVSIKSTFAKMSHRSFTDCMIYGNMDKRGIIKEKFTNKYRS